MHIQVLTYLILFFLSMVPLKGNTFASIRDVPIIENGEPLIDLKDQAIITYSTKFILEDPECTHMRKTVYEKLCEAEKLLPAGVRFELIEGLRSLKTQARLFDEIYKEIQEKFPEMNEKELFMETSKFVAPIKTLEGVTNVPPHSTGGAIDITLINQNGEPLDMGINPDDFYNEDFIRTDSPLISKEARKNRDIMSKALSEVGFVNYPGEFWHWSYGDKRWAFVREAKHSIYGPIGNP